MLDSWTSQRIRSPLNYLARQLKHLGISPDQVTIAGFFLGMTALPLIWTRHYALALAAVLINRILDGVDGALARMTEPTDAGGFLDITLDFIFYSAVVAGFALVNPRQNALAAALLIFSFVGTGSSFLAFSTMASKNRITSVTYPYKSLYYMGGITEGTETLLFFVVILLFPLNFPLFAAVFSLLCWITTILRIYGGYTTLKSYQLKKSDTMKH